MFINTAAGKRFQVDISAEDNIRTLKNMIMDETGAPPKHQALSFNGVEMNNNKASLASYGVDPSSSEVNIVPFYLFIILLSL